MFRLVMIVVPLKRKTKHPPLTGSWNHDLDKVKVVSCKTLQIYCGHSKYTRNALLDGSLLRYRYPLDGCTLY